MISGNPRRFVPVRAFVLTALLAIGLVASAAFPIHAQTSGAWASTGTLNTPRTFHTATLLQNGQVLVVGGESGTTFLTSAELYNSATGKWTVTGSTATSRMDHVATLLPNGEVLVAGGYLGVDSSYHPIYTATAELYNPSTGRWTPAANMTVPRAFAGAALLPNGQVLVAGGSNADGTSNTTAELYNPSTGAWTATSNMPIGESSPATVLANGQVLVAGGDGGELYNPSTGRWTKTPALYYFGSTGISATLLPNGDGLIYGNKFSCYAGQFYNPSTNTWARTIGQCGNAISSGPLTLLGTGKVLLAGAIIIYSGHASPTANCRLYDPATNSWTLTGSLLQSVRHSATRLLNGQVLAVGGSDAELYTP